MSTATIDRRTFRAPTREQAMEALAEANRVRFYRAAVKREVAADWQRAARALSDDDPDLRSMKVWDLLMPIRKFGAVKVNRLLVREHISVSKTIGGLTARQRSALVLDLARHHGGKLPLGGRG